MEIYMKSFVIIVLHLCKAFKRIGTDSITEFPLKKFLGVDNAIFLQQYRKKLLCSIYMNQTSTCCQCDPICVRYRSCCADYHWYVGPFNDVEVYKKYLVELSKTFKENQCNEPFHHISNENLRFKKYYTIHSCPETSTNKELELCQTGSHSLKTSIPVRGTDGYIYQNMYCARCNNVEEFEPIPLQMKCDTNMTEYSCIIEINSSENIVQCTGMRLCKSENEFTNLCKSFQGILNNNWINYFCILCFNRNVNPVLERVTIRDCHQDATEYDQFWTSKPEFIDTSKRHNCKARSIIDVAKGKCAPFSCPGGYQVADSKCFKRISSIPWRTLNILLFDECFLNENTKLYGLNVTEKLLVKIMKSIKGKDVFIVDSDAKRVPSLVKILDRTTENTRRTLLSPDDEFIYYIGAESRLILSQNDFGKLSFYKNPTTMFLNNRLCAKPIIITSKVNITSNCDLVINNTVISRSKLAIWVEFNRNYIKRAIYTCSSFYLPMDGRCLIRHLDSNSMFLRSDDKLVYLFNGNEKIYDIEEYTPLQEGLYGVCSHATPNIEEFCFFIRISILMHLITAMTSDFM